MSSQLERTARRTIEHLHALARDLKHERPPEMTPEESDKRVAAKLEKLARELAGALESREQEHEVGR